MCEGQLKPHCGILFMQQFAGTIK